MNTKSTAIGPRSLRIAIAVVVATAAVSVLWVRAGTLDPPAGPIAPTMHSLDEIYDSVAALGAPANLSVVGALEVIAGGSDWPGQDSVPPTFTEVIRVLGFNQGMVRPFDLGSPSGRPEPGPLTVVLDIGPSTPLAFRALTMNELIDARLHLVRPVPGGKGGMEHYFDIEILGARVDVVQAGLAASAAASGNAQVYELSFVYNNIQWTAMEGGISHQWVWTEP